MEGMRESRVECLLFSAMLSWYKDLHSADVKLSSARNQTLQYAHTSAVPVSRDLMSSSAFTRRLESSSRDFSLTQSSKAAGDVGGTCKPSGLFIEFIN